MIQFHFYVFWTKQNYGFIGEIICFFGILAAPFFLIISGISFFILIEKRRCDGNTKSNILLEVIKRTLFIFVFSTICQLLLGFTLSMNVSSIIYWSIFQVIAFSMIIFFITPFLKRFLRIFFYLFFSFLLFLINYTILIFNIEILYILVEGTFPFIPWANCFIFGLFIGDLLINSFKDRSKRKILISLIIGTMFLSIGLLLTNRISNLFTTSFFIMVYGISKIFFFLIVFGIFLILFSITYFIFDVKKLNFFFIKTLICWGEISFSIYYIQYAIIVCGIIIFPFLLSDWYLFGLSVYHYIIFLLIAFLALGLFIKLWHKFDYILGVEWLMNKFIHKSIFSAKTKNQI